MINNAALRTELRLIEDYLSGEKVTELSINKPGEVFIEEAGTITQQENKDLTFDRLMSMATLIASANEQSINETKPILSGSLPDGERVQILIPPCVEPGHVCMSIRKPSGVRFTLEDYKKAGAFDGVKVSDGLSLTPPRPGIGATA